MNVFRLGTRGSALALWQANYVKSALEKQGISVELKIIQTHGDRSRNAPIMNLGAQGVFTKEIQRALLQGEIDGAVHSLKDLPTEPVPGLLLASVPVREEVRDVLVSNKVKTIEELAAGDRIGTGSLRRKTQLLYHLPQGIIIEDIRGNVETRLRKLDQGDYDALVLAAAGLIRLGQRDRIASYLPVSRFLPAVGQGALGLEARLEDSESIRILSLLDDRKTHYAVLAERALLAALEGGCIAPIGTRTWWEQDDSKDFLGLHGRLLSPDGTRLFEHQERLEIRKAEDAVRLGEETAQILLKAGGSEIVEDLKRTREFS
ncbi:MAG: hydroxymethylbilane synthase [Planctomycetia bacterium]|nr:hydroxymethylbilane synthase [Planctomycetia bacterium]